MDTKLFFLRFKMQLNKFLKSFFISKEYKLFAFFSSLSICFAYILLILISYKNHKDTYNQKYSSLGFVISNSYEIFLDNILRQSEFIGYKIKYNEGRKDFWINNLLQHKFSINTDLDTSLVSSWVKFKWISANKETDDDIINWSKHSPWKLHFESLHSNSFDSQDYYIPISFGITDKYENFIGKLVSDINISNLIKYLQHNIQNKELDIIILDKENNIIGQSNTKNLSVPKDFFKNQEFTKYNDNIYKEFKQNNTVYIAYNTLNSYPFTIIVGDNKSTIFRPLLENLIQCFFIFISILLFFLILLFIFYKRIISPLTSLSHFAKDIVSSEKTINYKPVQNSSLVEIKNLEQALIKLDGYKKEIKNSNKELNSIKIRLELELALLSNSYNLRDSFLKKSLKDSNEIMPQEAIKQALTILYPEIYSRQLQIVESTQETKNLDIKHSIFIKIVIGLLSRSFIFSKKNGLIIVKTETTLLNNEDYFSLVIKDDGIGDEEWRKETLNNDCEIESIKLLIEENYGTFHCINDQESGVKYCIILPYKRKIKNTGNVNNVIPFTLIRNDN